MLVASANCPQPAAGSSRRRVDNGTQGAVSEATAGEAALVGAVRRRALEAAPVRSRSRRSKTPGSRRCVAELYGELDARGIRLRPRCYLGDEWFSPAGVPAIAIPFYLAHPRLQQLEKKMMMEVEGGGGHEDTMRFLRHECGHAVCHAFVLAERPDWKNAFGSPAQEFRDHYRYQPYSRNFVRHLENWYAQSHPGRGLRRNVLGLADARHRLEGALPRLAGAAEARVRRSTDARARRQARPSFREGARPTTCARCAAGCAPTTSGGASSTPRSRRASSTPISSASSSSAPASSGIPGLALSAPPSRSDRRRGGVLDARAEVHRRSPAETARRALRRAQALRSPR